MEKGYLGENSGWELFGITDENKFCSAILEWNEIV